MGVRLAVLAGIVLSAAGLAYLGVRRNQSVTLPAPQGPYAVGRIITEWTDETRPEELGASSASGALRRLSVWIWYPAREPLGRGERRLRTFPLGSARQPIAAVGSLLFQAIGSIHGHAQAAATPAQQAGALPGADLRAGAGAAGFRIHHAGR